MSIYAAGLHRVAHGRIDGAALAGLLTEAGTIPTMYTDPPWGDRMMRFFATMAVKQGGQPPPQMTFADLVARLALIVQRHISRDVYIEIGCAQAEQVAEAVRPHVGRLEVVDATYTMGGKVRPSKLIVASKEGALAIPPERPGGLKMVVNCFTACGARGVVLDPCCGLGYTARAALKLGLTFYGNEYSKVRLDRTLQFLGKGKS